MVLAPGWRPPAASAHPVRFICPFPSGGVVDGIIRAVMPGLSANLARPVFVETHAGANGALAAQQLRSAPPDGNHWMMITLGTVMAQAMNPSAFPAPGHFMAAGVVAYDIPVIVVPASLPARTLADLMALGRREPGSLNYLRTGVGSLSHLVIAILQRGSDVLFEAVDYRGLPPGITDLLAGRIQLGVLNVGLALPHLRSGSLRAIAAVGPSRLPHLPDLPTLAELHPDAASISAWAMVVLRRDTSPPAFARISNAFRATLAQTPVRDGLRRLGVVPASPDEHPDPDVFLQEEQARSRALAQSLGIVND